MSDKDLEQAAYPNTREGWQRRWTVEIEAATKHHQDWWDMADKIVKRFVDEREEKRPESTRINLFTANVQTLQALLFGKTPKVDVTRRFTDHMDDVARVAATILKRLLNNDIENSSDTYVSALTNALDDRLKVGLGMVRLRYEAKHKAKTARKGQEPVKVKTWENVSADYLYWRDVLWSPCRVREDMRWQAFLTPLTKDQFQTRFPGVSIGNIPFDRPKVEGGQAVGGEVKDANLANPWNRVNVWEIWDKEHGKVWWYVKGAREIIDFKKDIYRLEGFWPTPPSLIANTTTSSYLPTPDYKIAKDIYEEIDSVSTRITVLERAVQVKGIYDSSNDEIKRLLNEAVAMDLIPAENFSLIAEKGGLRGVIDWLPLEMFTQALDILRQYRTELISLLFQVTGMSDILRGEATSGGTTAAEQQIKAEFASVRINRFRDIFAQFASDIQQIKAELISKFYDAATIAERANVKYLDQNDQQFVPAAIALIKSPTFQFRVVVKPEAISAADYAAIKQERSEFLTAMATFIQSATPFIQMAGPAAAGPLMSMLQWAMAGFKGGSTIEGELDGAIKQMQMQMMAPKPPGPPDPKVQSAQVKAQAEMGKAQAGLQQSQMDTQAHAQETALDLHTMQEKHKMEMAKLRAEVQVMIAKTTATAAVQPPAGGAA